MWCVDKDLGDTACNEGGDDSTTSSAALVVPDQESFPPVAPQPSVLHFGSQCSLRPLHRSSGNGTLLKSRISCI